MEQGKKILTFSQAINLNFGVLGILFGWELQIANVSGIYAFFGANENSLGYLWLAPSIIGLLIPLIIGYFSDRTYSSFGKRLPYIFFGAVLTSMSMFWLPNASSLFLAVILVCIFTAGINTAFQPFKALVPDVVIEKEHTKVYAIQAALIGIGATTASMMPWALLFFFNHHAKHESVPFEIKLAFYIGAIILIAACFWTTIKTKSYLPVLIKPLAKKNALKIESNRVEKIASLFSSIPKVMWQTSLVQFFTWIGVFCFIIYLTPAIEKSIFNVSLGVHHFHNAASKESLEKSVVLNGICCAIYMGVNIIYAYIIPFLSKLMTRKMVHVMSLSIGGLSLLSFVFVHHTTALFISMIGIGMTWASFNCLPFAMVASSIPGEKMGFYMGLFNASTCLPQIIVSLGVGFVLKNFLHSNAVDLMLLSGASLLIAAFLTLFVQDKSLEEIV